MGLVNLELGDEASAEVWGSVHCEPERVSAIVRLGRMLPEGLRLCFGALTFRWREPMSRV